MSYYHAQPDDGYAYSPIELEAIAAINVSFDDIESSMGNAFEFHARAAMLPNNPQREHDRWAISILARAIAAEIWNPEPEEPPPWPCPMNHNIDNDSDYV